MSTVQEIEHAIGKLSPQEVEELRAWIEEQYLQHPVAGRLLSESIAMAGRSGRLASEAIAIAEEEPQPVMDEDFAEDMREIIANRKPREFAQWD